MSSPTARHPRLYDTPLPHTLGPHLPLPGKAPDWPYTNIGKWQIDVNADAASWRARLDEWRREHKLRMGYTDALYAHPDLLWAQRNFVHTQLMVEDRYFYDPVARRYTVDRYLDDLEARFGGIDSVLLWYVYPNIGVDDRNQFQLAEDLPGGIDGLRGVVADFHRRGVRVFLPTMPWDNGTCDQRQPDWEAAVALAARVGADGINGDTYHGVPRAFHEAAARAGHRLVFQPEGSLTGDEALQWNLQSWGKASTEIIPAVSKLKWLEPRHMINLENRWCRERTDDFHYMFFNGVGYTAWENVWGIWNGLTERDGATLRRIATIYRAFPDLLVSAAWEPYALALQQNVFASCFPGAAATLWTVVNRNEYACDGEMLKVAHRPGRRYIDAWNGTALTARLEDDGAILALALEKRGFGAVIAVDGALPQLDSFLATMRALAVCPLQQRAAGWQPLAQRLVAIAATAPAARAPAGMVAIPAGSFNFEVGGVEVEGYTAAGTDVQYPWESTARRRHRHRLQMRPFFIDRCPVTNAQFKDFIDASGYRPADPHNFLRHWIDGAPPPGWHNKPVTWVGLEDARAYAAWAGKRLPREWEWQYAAQGLDERRYPWGDTWEAQRAPAPHTGRALPVPADVDAHPGGASPFGVLDLVGNVWQWTDEYVDEHTRAAIVRGGSAYRPQTSHWYFPQALRLDQHGKYLLLAPCKDRSGMIGLRCVVDAA